MDILVAVAHIVGSILAVVALWIVAVVIAAWETSHNERKAMDEIALHFGIPVDSLDADENSSKIIRFASDKYSSELLRNRLSDLSGFLRTVWGWIGSLTQIAIVIGVSWFTFTDDLQNAVNSWFIVAVFVIFSIVSIVFSLVCKLLTGRYPGQAKQVRKHLSGVLNKQKKNVD